MAALIKDLQPAPGDEARRPLSLGNGEDIILAPHTTRVGTSRSTKRSSSTKAFLTPARLIPRRRIRSMAVLFPGGSAP